MILILCATHHDDTTQWKKELDDGASEEGRDIPVYLLANKCDLLVDMEESMRIGGEMERMCRDLGFSGWFCTSAKKGAKIEEAFLTLSNDMRGRQAASASSTGRQISRKPSTVDLNNYVTVVEDASEDRKRKKKVCC